MDQDVQPKANASPDDAHQSDADVLKPVTADGPPPVDDEAGTPVADDADHARDERITRAVHIALGLLIAALGGWLLYRSRTELAFRGPNGRTGPRLSSGLADDLPDRTRVVTDGGVGVRRQGTAQRCAHVVS